MRSHVVSSFFRTKKLFCESINSRKYNAITYSKLKQSMQFSTDKQKKNSDIEVPNTSDEPNLVRPLDSKYKYFDDKDSQIIFDVSEEQEKIYLDELNIEQEHQSPYAELNLERGEKGVFNIEDLVLLLQKDNAKDIFVVSVPTEYSYVDYIVIVTGKSYKHSQALATFVRKVYKLKKHKTDIIPKIEGEKSKDWIAMDLGNIALHIFSKSCRKEFDLETLWSVGPEYDEQCNTETDNINIMEQYNAFLTDLEPADANETQST